MSDFLQGKLDNQEIYKKLLDYKYASGFKPSKKFIDDIINKFWFHDFYNSLVSDPVFLEYLEKYLTETKPKTFNRFDFYQFLFGQIVKEKVKIGLLQLIGIAFERLQTDAIDPFEYKRLTNALKVPKGFFDISWMEKNHLAKLGDREGKKYFIWEHHTLTEFLTATYIIRAKNPLQEFIKLAVLEQEGIVALKPSWTGVLRFLLESPKGKEVLNWLVSFLDKYKDNIDDNISELLTFVDIDVSAQASKKIFELIYNSYFDRIVWLPVWASSCLPKFIDSKSYVRLKEDIKDWSNITETFVKRGNVVSIVKGLLERKDKSLSPQEKQFWRIKLIDFANTPNDEGNGVLQRHSLAALAYFEDDKIIPLVADKCFDQTQDSLIRDEFIQFCIISAPNSTNAIDYLIKGIKHGSTIYARHGLYKITSPEAIEYFLSKIAGDEEFLSSFLEHESIFDKEGGDEELVKNIAKKPNSQTITLLKKLIFTVLRISSYYKENRSNFLQQIVRLISQHDPKYLFEVLEDFKKEKDEQKTDRLFYDSKELLALLLTKDNVKEYFKTLENFPDRTKRDTPYPVYIAKRLNGDVGNQVYQEAVVRGYIYKVDEDQSQKNFDEQQNKKKQEIYNSFINQLEPAPSKYIPSVFEYFLHNRKEIEEQWQEKDKKRLLKLAVGDGIEKINPREFKVTIPDKKTHQFSWSTVASYYGNILSLLHLLAPEEIQKHRQNIIDFIPFAFSDDMSLIADLIPKLIDDELSFVNKVMINLQDDRRYLIPGSYIYLVGQYAKKGCKLPGVKPVLLSLIGDNNIPNYEQRSALENLALFIDNSDKKTKVFLIDIFEKSKDKELSKTANALLIKVYKDEYSIDWRFAQLKIPIEFDRKQIEGFVHSMGPGELELDSLAFAKPLIELRDEKYLPKFFDLLTYSFKVIEQKKDKKYLDYVNYLWRIVIAFVDNLKENGSFKPLLVLETWVVKNSNSENANWLMAKIRNLRNSYIDNIGKKL